MGHLRRWGNLIGNMRLGAMASFSVALRRRVVGVALAT